MIEILRIISGKETVVCTVPDDNASVVSEIMGREEVNASVTVDGPLGIRVGDFVRVDGTVYTLNREAGMEKRSDVEFRYDLVFESPLYRLLDKLFTNPVTGVSTFTVSRTLKEFVKIAVDCVNTIDPGWTVSPGIPDTDPVNLTFEGISCREVLTRLSDGFGMEFYLSGREIRFVRDMENATGLVFEQGKGKGLYTVTQEPVDTGDIVTRVYPYGGTTNVFPADGDVNGRLYLPEGYLEDLTGYGKVVEREVVFDDIFPCLKASVDSVSGEYNRVLTCEAIGFDINLYGIGGVAAKINFLSGELMGESFSFTYTHASKQINLIRKEDMTALPDSGGKRPLIPHDLKKVKAGDRFNLTDIYVPEEYKEKAIVELRAKATDYLAYYSRPRVKFTLEVDYRYLRGRGVLRAGDVVTVKIPETGMEKPLRVNSVERNLKTGKMSCVVSNYLDEKWEKRIEGELTSIKSSVSGDISDIRGEVSNVSRPSSLWYPDKLKEYLHSNEDGTITLLATDLIVEGHIKSRKSITAYASDGSTPSWFDSLPVASYDLRGVLKITKDEGLVVSDGILSLDPDKVGGIKSIAPIDGKGNVITGMRLSDDGKTITPVAGITALNTGGGTMTGVLNSSVADGTAPFSITSRTIVPNLNVTYLGGKTYSDIINGNVATATRLQTSRTLWSQPFDGSGNVSGAMSGVTKINSMIHLDVAGTVGLGDKSGSWARLTGNRLDGMTVGGVMSDLYLNYSSPARNVRIDKDGNLIVSGNIKATGAIVAYASDGSTPSWFDQLPVAGYEDGTKGVIRAYSGQFTVDSITGVLKIKEGAVGFGNILFTGSGSFLSDVTASADKKTLTFTRVGKPTYTVSEITNAVSTTDARLTNARPASDVYAWAKAASRPAYNYSEVGAAQSNQNPNVNLDTVNGIGIMCNPANANATMANKYPIAEAGTLFYGTAAYNSANQVYGSFSSNRWFARGGGMSPTAKTAWREFAFLDSVVSKNGDTMNGSLVVNGSIYSNTGNYVSRIVGTTGGWERGLKWDSLDGSVNHGSVTMFGSASTPGYISMGFGAYDDLKRLFVSSNGYVGIGLLSPLDKFHVWGNVRAEGYLYSNANGFQLRLGSQNASYCHYETTAPSHYFNKNVIVDGHVLPHTNNNLDLGNRVNRWLDIHLYSWIRIYGTNGGGLYFNNWGGGISMADSTYVKIYNGKAFKVENTASDAIHVTGGIYSEGVNGNGITIIGSARTTAKLTGQIGADSNAPIHRYIVYWYNNYASFDVHRGTSDNILKWSWKYNDVEKAVLDVNGNFTSKSAITAYSTNGSDMRRKTVINPRYDLDPRSLLKVWTFTYRWDEDKDDTPLVGMSAQQMLRIAPSFVMGANDEKGGYYTFDYGRFGAIGLVKTVQYVLPWMDEKDRKIIELENRVRCLEDKLNIKKAA